MKLKNQIYNVDFSLDEFGRIVIEDQEVFDFINGATNLFSYSSNTACGSNGACGNAGCENLKCLSIYED